MKEFLLGPFNFTTSFIMWIPSLWIRKTYLRIFLGHMGKNVFIARNVDIRKPKNVFIGDNTVINKNVLLDGRGARLQIEDNVDVAQEVNIWTLTHDVNDGGHKAVGFPVRIGSHAWLGARSTIMPGVDIGSGAVAGINSVVTHNVQRLDIVAGIPARVIGKRNNDLGYVFNYSPWFM